MKVCITAMILYLVFAYSLHSQSIQYYDFDYSDFPTVRAKFIAFDENSRLLRPGAEEFSISENGVARDVRMVSCPPLNPRIPLSTVLTFNIRANVCGYSYISSEVEAIREWIRLQADDGSECAIASFDNYSYLHHDFSTDKESLLSSLDTVLSKRATNYDVGLLFLPAGALQISKNGKHQKIIFLITNSGANEPEIEFITGVALNQNAKIYSIVLGIDCPESLKEISTRTGGKWYQRVNAYKLRDFMRLVYMDMFEDEPCSIEWESDLECEAIPINLDIRFNDLTFTRNYVYPSQKFKNLEVTPKTISFSPVETGIALEQTITVTAENTDFNVTDIHLTNPAFTIIPTSFSLNAGESMELELRYLPADGGYNYCTISFINDECPKVIHARGGNPWEKPTLKTLKLLHPKGDEAFVVGMDTLITWEGVLPDEPVRIEYSTNNGNSWITISDSATDFSYNWRVPNTPSNQCLARVTVEYVEPTCETPDTEICGLIWSACNIEVINYRNGDTIFYAQTAEQWEWAWQNGVGAWCFYGNQRTNGKDFGKLYNWFAVNDPRGLAPEGWRIATREDWESLIDCLGGSSIAGGSAKAIGTLEVGDGLWRAPNEGATNDAFYFAMPGGSRNETGEFSNIGYYGYWWTSVGYIADFAVFLRMNYNSTNINLFSASKGNGFSVRCVKDE